MLSIIIPLKNEEEAIKSTVEKIIYQLHNIKYEIILIDDFSEDRTSAIAEKYSKENTSIKFFKNEKKGLGPLINLGVEKSSGSYIAIMMADLSDDIEDLKKYYEIINESNYDAILGTRFSNYSKLENYPLTKLILNRLFNYFVKVIFLSDYNDFTNAFKIYKKTTLIKLRPFVSESFNIFLELPLKVISRKYEYKIIPINWKNRKDGKSKFKIKELGAKYIFTLIYCFAEKILLKK